MKFLTTGISLPFTAHDGDFITIASQKMKRAADPATFHFCVYKKSIDARKRDDIRFVCSVMAETDRLISPKLVDAMTRAGFKPVADMTEEITPGNEKLYARPLVVGCGPAGMFCALNLAERGYRPILIDRGGDVDSRVAAYSAFCRDRVLDTENNIQFGAGGAGTFSDGKLTTRINDPKCSYVLERMKEFGAPDDITVKAKPHVGTDKLREVVRSLTAAIKEHGGDVIYNCRLDGIRRIPSGGLAASTSKGEIPAGCIVLATGHSSRDTYDMLMSDGYGIVVKPFSVGVRIEHLQSDTDAALYGRYAGDPRLGPAEYNYSDTSGRGVYTFCMCPGGEIVAAATEEGGVVVNGMSFRARDGKNSNSAIAVTVNPEDCGNDPKGAIEYQRKLERTAYGAGGGNFTVPVQTVGDFLDGTLTREPSRVMPSYMGGNSYKVADLTQVFPDYVTSELRRGIRSFARRHAGFDSPDAVLSGVETRTSSPVRILRGDGYVTGRDDLIYPCGEGAGYAGGITSAAVDGIKVSEAIISRFAPPDGD